MMDLRIVQKPALIGLDIARPAIKLRITAPQLDLNTGSSPELRITKNEPKVFIDNSQVWQDIGLARPVQFLWASSTQSLDSGLQAIGEIAAEGDALAAIADGGSIPAVVAHEVQIDAEVECNVALMPKEPPKISSNVQVFPVDVRLHPVALDAQLKRGEVQNLTPWASVKMYLLQQPYFDIQWVGNRYDAVA
jgi:hypothetical protein